MPIDQTDYFLKKGLVIIFWMAAYPIPMRKPWSFIQNHFSIIPTPWRLISLILTHGILREA